MVVPVQLVASTPAIENVELDRTVMAPVTAHISVGRTTVRLSPAPGRESVLTCPDVKPCGAAVVTTIGFVLVKLAMVARGYSTGSA